MAEHPEPREQPESAGAAADEQAGELSEEQLGQVAGGGSGTAGHAEVFNPGGPGGSGLAHPEGEAGGPYR